MQSHLQPWRLTPEYFEVLRLRLYSRHPLGLEKGIPEAFWPFLPQVTL